MAIPNVPTLDPGGLMTHNVPPPVETAPYADTWFTESTVENIDHQMMGWLVAQGWIVTDTVYDDTTTPPTPSYTMTKRTMNNWTILQTLMSSLTSAFNDGRTMNYLRYKDIIVIWNLAFGQSEQQYDQMTAKSNADVVVYMDAFTNDVADVATQIGLARGEAIVESDRVTEQLAVYVSKLEEIESNYESNKALIELLLAQQAEALMRYLASYAAQLDVLDTEYSTHTAALDALLADMTTDLTSHIAAQSAKADQLLTDYTTHAAAVGVLQTNAEAVLTAHSAQVESLLTTILADYTSLSGSISSSLSELETAFGDHAASYENILTAVTNDFTTHAVTARAFLTDLGATELARINEAFDARLSVVAQNLVNRGFYSSAIVNDEQERVERERNQAIVELNDRLAREKLTNEHQLFEQQDKMRVRTLEGRDRLYVLQQDVLRYEAQQVYQLFGLLQGVRDRTLAAKQVIYGIKDQFTRLQLEVANNLETRLTAVRTRTMEMLDRIQVLRDGLSRAKLQNASQVYAELATVRRLQIDGAVQMHAAEQDVSRNEASQRDKLLAQLQSAVAAVLDGRMKYSQMSLQKGQYLSDMRVKLNVQLMEIAARKLQMRQGTSHAELDLMKYQIDSKNNFLVGMFRVIQDRNDDYPDITEIAKLAFSLGDAGERVGRAVIMFRKPRQPAPFFRMPGAPFNPITGDRAFLGPDKTRGTTLAIFQVVGDDPSPFTEADTHANYISCRGYDPDADPQFRYHHDPVANASSTPINVAKPFAVRGTFPYERGQIVVAARIRTKLGDNQGVAADTTGHPADLYEEVEILRDDDDVAVAWMDISAPPITKRFSVTKGTLTHGSAVTVERIKRQGGAWVRSGSTYTAYDIFLNTGESLAAGTIVSTIRYEGVDVIDAMYCVANDWLG